MLKEINLERKEMSGGSYRGGSSIVGPKGFSTMMTEDKINKGDLTVLGDVEKRTTRNVPEEKVLILINVRWKIKIQIS